ncbi:pyruvate dehydrogenase E2 component (dihydrolipoamide acetyltransferase) [Haloarcula vallismortis]|uniref:Branched-chain alpha-keto acid dehydrogenase subunit E2 n=2 Tax=Haloarcula vallismortis TaxID=28442 RepID=M0J7X8_HALVA|nr:dihydrolipoamide acetyltransferase family protein [Haloarcula vallismortis]EMA05061.1 branched-chain alpha-keto acid dehydrogenase subunit E2 [Haloarcula vallismortis ATCC 29715]SDX12616.1 pyruvate dehydrogenase E2 component (dihydrolipoamide acetyltransferase) [Haloarcula vallismortis]
MVREFELPDVGEGVAEGELLRWRVEPGDSVSEDQPVAEVETDKAVVDVPSPVDGVVEELRAGEGETVPVGDVIIVFRVEDEDGAETASTDNTTADTSQQSTIGATAQPASDTQSDPEVTQRVHIPASPSVRRLARSLGVDISSIADSSSGRITKSDVRAHAGADPATQDRSTQQTAAPTQRNREAASAQSVSPAQTGDTADRETTVAVPKARHIAAEAGIDLDTVPTDEQKDGEPFVTLEAVQEYAKAQQQAQKTDGEALAEGAATDDPARPESRKPYNGIRQTIGSAMTSSKYTAPHVTHQDEVDVTALVDARSTLKQEAEEHGTRLTYMPFVMKACAAALKKNPQVNASLDEANEEIVEKQYYNIGVATATDAGLLVPVVKDVDKKDLFEVASETNEKTQKARERRLSPAEMRDGTFTISNIGGIGGEYGTPIINQPESAILALGAIKKKPRVVEADGEETIEPRHIMTLSLSFDHRVLDGADAAQFTNSVQKYLRNPNLLLLE